MQMKGELKRNFTPPKSMNDSKPKKIFKRPTFLFIFLIIILISSIISLYKISPDESWGIDFEIDKNESNLDNLNLTMAHKKLTENGYAVTNHSSNRFFEYEIGINNNSDMRIFLIQHNGDIYFHGHIKYKVKFCCPVGEDEAIEKFENEIQKIFEVLESNISHKEIKYYENEYALFPYWEFFCIFIIYSSFFTIFSVDFLFNKSKYYQIIFHGEGSVWKIINTILLIILVCMTILFLVILAVDTIWGISNFFNLCVSILLVVSIIGIYFLLRFFKHFHDEKSLNKFKILICIFIIFVSLIYLFSTTLGILLIRDFSITSYLCGSLVFVVFVIAVYFVRRVG